MPKGFDASKVIRSLQILFAVGILVLLWRLVESEQALKLLLSAEPIWLIASFLAISLQTILSAMRWRLTAGQLGLALGLGTALREYYLGQMVNQALPGGVLGDAGRAVRSRSAAGLLTSGQAVVLERIAGQVALFALMLVALALTMLIPLQVQWPVWLLVTIGLVASAFAAFALGLLFIARNTSGKTGRFLKGIGTAAQLAFLSRKVFWKQSFLSLGTAVCNVAGFTFAAWAIGFQLSFLIALAIVPLILMAMLLPLTISGWGLREGVAVLLFPIIGATATQGLVASVAFGLICLLAALPGLAFIRGARKIEPKVAQGIESSV
jgi:Predicted integral membrane protein